MRKLLIIFVAISVLMILINFPTLAIADWDVTVEILDLHITKDTDPAFNDPDPYIMLKLLRPEPSYKLPAIIARSPTITGQAPCTHPHAGRKWVSVHINPIHLSWSVYDEDWDFDDLMTDGGTSLTIGGDPCVVESNGPAAYIKLKITQELSECGQNKTFGWRDIPRFVNAELSTSIPVTLTLHVDETNTPNSINLYEQIPTGFTFEDANPAPAEVTSTTDPNGLDLTILRWEFPSHPGGETTITYNVTTPASAEQLTGSFGMSIDVDGTVLYPLAPGNHITLWGLAWNPTPPDGAETVSPLTGLTWTVGTDANLHDVYFGTDGVAVQDANTAIPLGVYEGRQDSNGYEPGTLEFTRTYFWRIDTVNEVTEEVWKGDLWSFTTGVFLIVDNMDSYANTTALEAVWTETNGADLKLEKTPALVRDGNSMMFTYDNAKTGGLYKGSEAEASTADLGAGTDWTANGVKALVLYFQGDADNAQEGQHIPGEYHINNDQMYVAVKDGDGNSGIVKYDKEHNYDMNDIKKESWQEWNIDLADPCLSDVNMADVAKVYIGFGGAKTGQAAGGAGEKSGKYDTVWFDDIRLWPPRCRPEKVATDFTGDCITNYADVDIMARDWLQYDYNVPAVAISGDPCGWWKFDEGEGNTVADSSSNNNGVTVDPTPSWVTGHPNDPCDSAMSFNGITDYVLCAERVGTGPGTYPAELMLDTFTVACWVKLDSFTYYGGFVVNGFDDTGSDQSGFYLCSRDDKAFVLGIRTEDSMNYVRTAGIYKTDTWYHVAGTYNDANTATVYVDGKLAAGPRDVGGPIRWVSSYSGNYPDYFVIGGLPGRSGPLDWYYADGIIDDVRVYDYALSYGEIVTLAEQGPALYHEVISPANIYDLEGKLSKKVNFRDYAILADNWLEEFLWPSP